MIFRAKLPKRPMPTTRIGRYNSQKFTYYRLPDELYNEVSNCAFITNRGYKILFPKYCRFVFVISKNKPIDTELLKWEEIQVIYDVLTNPQHKKNYRIKEKTVLGWKAEWKRRKMYELRKERDEKKKLRDGVRELRINPRTEETKSTEEQSET